MSISSVNPQIDGTNTLNSGLSDERQARINEQTDRSRPDSLNISAMPGKLDSLLEEISDRGANALEALKERSIALQESFLDRLYEQMDSRNIDLQEKVTLRLNEDGLLATAGEHPQKDEINGLLADNPELTDTFRDIASHSELMRDIGNIRKNVTARSQMQQYEDTAQNNPLSVYQLSLKGGMSHFFFSPGKA